MAPRVEDNRVHCFDEVTNEMQVEWAVRAAMHLDPNARIWVFSGTHGDVNGNVDPSYADFSFASADRMRAAYRKADISVIDYQTVRDWGMYRPMGRRVRIVLAWCYSYQWYNLYGRHLMP